VESTVSLRLSCKTCRMTQIARSGPLGTGPCFVIVTAILEAGFGSIPGGNCLAGQLFDQIGGRIRARSQ